MKRRDLLKYSAATATVSLSGAGLYLFSKDKLKGFYYNIDYRPNGEGSLSELIKIDLNSGKMFRVPIAYSPHSVQVSPVHGEQCVLTEKWDTGICILNLNSKSVVSEFRHTNNSKRQFIGHSIFSPSGEIIYSSEAIFDNKNGGVARGIIGVRDAKTLELLKEFSSNGKDPHELVWLDEGKTFAVCNQGHYESGKSDNDRNISIIDALSGNVLEVIHIPLKLSPAHLIKLQSDQLIVVTRSLDFRNPFEQDQRLLLVDKNRNVSIFPTPDFLKGKLSKELLSLACCEASGIVATTYPDGKKLLFWSIQDFKFLKEVETGQVTGVSLSSDGAVFVVNDLNNGTLFYDAHTLKELKYEHLESFTKIKLEMPHSLITSH